MTNLLFEKYAYREDLSTSLATHLVGPNAVDERLSDQPTNIYSIGILYPRESLMDQEVLDLNGIPARGDNQEDNVSDEANSLSAKQFPSSMGMTFAVKLPAQRDLGTFDVLVEYAKYAKEGDQWARYGFNSVVSAIDASKPIVKIENLDGHGVSLRIQVRKEDHFGDVAITLALVNDNTSQPDRARQSENCFFQPKISVSLPENSGLTFADRAQRSTKLDDRDVLNSQLLFRHVQNLATGHGCAVQWDDSDQIRSMRTTYIPVSDMLLAESNPAIESWVLDMRAPALRPRIEVVIELRALISQYKGWIQEREHEIHLVPENLQAIARANLADCFKSLERMNRGIDVLSGDDVKPYQAFELMSAAMVEQRIRSEIVLAGRGNVAPEEIVARWRPFQLAFILQCLEGLAVPTSTDREIADLLWFPTGGGKTEAYLGLIAFTLMLRRLQKRPHGVSSLMRYTLRLLTTQQFERAALLMCCCDVIRKSRPELGDWPFEVGLYIGGKGSPNSLADATKALSSLRDNPDADVTKFGNPIQIAMCVWCGSALNAFNYFVDDYCQARCPNPECEFVLGLPWWTVDEDLFSRRPSLIIGTVDKFAGLATKDNAGNLFNQLPGQEAGLDLIIQDELHLISGPLGTLAGLYETAIDELGRTREGARPKIVASTATIRRATEQVQAVFDREVAQFPSPAIDSRDSFFAVESPADRRGTRRYIGVMAPSLSQATLMVRVYAQLFHQATLGNWSDEVRDVYWTLVAYFNSLRILASAQLLMLDDVADRLDLLGDGDHDRKPSENIIELTSRASGREIPAYLRQLRIGLPATETAHALLATNMISVGVDIDRLGLMVMTGQPQSTAEYIQSSSRVGRRDPGLVVTLYNAARSRDRSHYERFQPYHSALYRQVEATSVTPFSPRARNRALVATFVILARYLVPGLRENTAASKVESHLEELKNIRQLVVNRSQRVDPIEASDTGLEIDEFIDHWVFMANQNPSLLYYKYKSDVETLLKTNEDVIGEGDSIQVLTSMRDVDQSCKIYEVRGGRKNVAG
jgi:hypothetical protein